MDIRPATGAPPGERECVEDSHHRPSTSSRAEASTAATASGTTATTTNVVRSFAAAPRAVSAHDAISGSPVMSSSSGTGSRTSEQQHNSPRLPLPHQLQQQQGHVDAKFLVSDREEDDDYDETSRPERRTSSSILDVLDGDVPAPAPAPTDAAATAADAPGSSPSEIIPADEAEKGDGDDDEDGDEDESDYEYDYEDEDESGFSGFLVADPHPPIASVASSSSDVGAAAVVPTSSTATTVPQDDEADGAQAAATSTEAARRSSSVSASSTAEPAASASSTSAAASRTKWKEPTREAVSMSLRAEREKTGGRRRLASDLYRIMMKDTAEAGFKLEPVSEDSMDRWRIRIFAFDEDSNLAQDLLVLGVDHVELEMTFPDQYPFEPPFVRVVSPRFQRQTGFVMNGALCMELLTSEGWNPVNDIESVIVSIRSLLVVGDGRLQAAVDMPEKKREALLAAAKARESSASAAASAKGGGDDHSEDDDDEKKGGDKKRLRSDGEGGSEDDDHDSAKASKKAKTNVSKTAAGQYTAAEARAAYSHLTEYHKKKGWDQSGWWARKG